VPILKAPERFTHELGPVMFTSLATPSLGTRETALWRIDIPAGSPPTPHSLTKEELFLVLAGSARVEMLDETSTVHMGDVIVVPPNTIFTIVNDGESLLQLISCMPVGGEVQMGDITFTPPWIA
jgi:mannose-6-phosphate isomerase-like protein (cupin superfamily)